LRGNLEMLSSLLEGGANANGECMDQSLLCVAIERNDVRALKLLIKHGADPETNCDASYLQPRLHDAKDMHVHAKSILNDVCKDVKPNFENSTYASASETNFNAVSLLAEDLEYSFKFATAIHLMNTFNFPVFDRNGQFGGGNGVGGGGFAISWS
jgi:ankyrin repeat protein